jgi:hypothetical protein
MLISSSRLQLPRSSTLHVGLIVRFMMHLLSKMGLATRNVFNTACDAMTTEEYFVPDVQVLSHEFMRRLLADQVMISSLTRLAENWKTSVKRRSVLFVNSLRLTFTSLQSLSERFVLHICTVCWIYIFFNLLISCVVLQMDLSLTELPEDRRTCCHHTMVQLLSVALCFCDIKDDYITSCSSTMEALASALLCTQAVPGKLLICSI